MTNPTNPFYRFGKGPSSLGWGKVPFGLSQRQIAPPPGTSYAPGSITPQFQVPQPIGDMRGRNFFDRSQYGRNFERKRGDSAILEKLLEMLRDSSFGGRGNPASIEDLIKNLVGGNGARGGSGSGGRRGGGGSGGGGNGGGNHNQYDQNT